MFGQMKHFEGQPTRRSIMQATPPERRQLARFPLQVFVRIRTARGEQGDFAETRNISARGLYFHTHARLNVGQEIDCVLILPQRLTLAPSPILIGCRAKVLRVNGGLPNHASGVAVEVHSYDFSWQGGLDHDIPELGLIRN
jgi:hypothetical protein